MTIFCRNLLDNDDFETNHTASDNTAEETDHSDLRLEASKNALLLRRLKFDCQRIKQNKIRVEWYLPFSFNKLIRVNIPL